MAAALGLRSGGLPNTERQAFRELALVLDLVPDLRRWSREEKSSLLAIIRVRARGVESRYLRLLQRHARLRAALIRMGSR